MCMFVWRVSDVDENSSFAEASKSFMSQCFCFEFGRVTGQERERSCLPRSKEILLCAMMAA